MTDSDDRQRRIEALLLKEETAALHRSREVARELAEVERVLTAGSFVFGDRDIIGEHKELAEAHAAYVEFAPAPWWRPGAANSRWRNPPREP